MMGNDDNLAIPEIKDQETSKYKKNVNEIMENAEIEAELEAEKKIRSKNSRIFLISMIGFAFITITNFQINKKTTISQNNSTAPIKTAINNAEINLAKHTTIINDENSIISTPRVKETKLEAVLKPKIKSNKSSKKINNTIKNKLIEKVPSPELSKPKNSFLVQTGAFSLKTNANKLVKRLQKKGFNPSVSSIVNGSKKLFLVQLGVFQNKEKATEVQAKLARAGYSKTIIK